MNEEKFSDQHRLLELYMVRDCHLLVTHVLPTITWRHASISVVSHYSNRIMYSTNLTYISKYRIKFETIFRLERKSSTSTPAIMNYLAACKVQFRLTNVGQIFSRRNLEEKTLIFSWQKVLRNFISFRTVHRGGKGWFPSGPNFFLRGLSKLKEFCRNCECERSS